MSTTCKVTGKCIRMLRIIAVLEQVHNSPMNLKERLYV